MAGLTVIEGFEWQMLLDQLEVLPEYAHPLYARLCKSIDLTGTFKLSKQRLVQEGYARSSDPVWRLHPVLSPVQNTA